jgi:hypothetical protein
VKVHQARAFQEEGFEEAPSISRRMVGFFFTHLYIFLGSKAKIFPPASP